VLRKEYFCALPIFDDFEIIQAIQHQALPQEAKIFLSLRSTLTRYDVQAALADRILSPRLEATAAQWGVASFLGETTYGFVADLSVRFNQQFRSPLQLPLSNTSLRRSGGYTGWADRHTTSVAFAAPVCEQIHGCL